MLWGDFFNGSVVKGGPRVVCVIFGMVGALVGSGMGFGAHGFATIEKERKKEPKLKNEKKCSLAFAALLCFTRYFLYIINLSVNQFINSVRQSVI